MAVRVTNVLGMPEARGGLKARQWRDLRGVGAVRLHSMPAFPVNNRKKQGERAQPGATSSSDFVTASTARCL